MAVIFGVPPPVPLALMPKGQNVGGDGGAAAASSRCALRAKELPPRTIRSGAGKGGRAAGGSEQKEPRRRDSVARTGQKPLQMWTRPWGGAFPRQFEAALRADSGGPLKVSEKF